MDLAKRLTEFLKLSIKNQLEGWKELNSIATSFLQNDTKDTVLARKLCEAINYHRSLMGSSKAFESATDIDIELCETALKIARIGHGKTEALLTFLNAALYYANFSSDEKLKHDLSEEIKSIKTTDANKSL